MDKIKILQDLGLCKRANKIISGEEQVLESIKSNSAKIVFLASDSGKNTAKRITDKSKYYNVRIDINFTTEELNNAIGTENRKVLAINDKNFAKMIISKLDY